MPNRMRTIIDRIAGSRSKDRILERHRGLEDARQRAVAAVTSAPKRVVKSLADEILEEISRDAKFN